MMLKQPCAQTDTSYCWIWVNFINFSCFWGRIKIAPFWAHRNTMKKRWFFFFIFSFVLFEYLYAINYKIDFKKGGSKICTLLNKVFYLKTKSWHISLWSISKDYFTYQPTPKSKENFQQLWCLLCLQYIIWNMTLTTRSNFGDFIKWFAKKIYLVA